MVWAIGRNKRRASKQLFDIKVGLVVDNALHIIV